MNEKDTKATVQSQFGRNAQNYVNSKIHKKGKDLSKLIEIANLTGGEYALDIATGGGHTANALASLCQKVVALDLTTEILAVARKFIEENGHNNIEFIQADAENLPFQDETFDIITCRVAAHHFPNVSIFLKETYRALKNEGIFLLIDNVSPENNEFDQFYNMLEKKRDCSHHRAYKKSEWIQMLEEHRFIIEELHVFSKTFIFDDWCKNMNVSNELKERLTYLLLQSKQEIVNKFKVITKDTEIYSFTGEAVLIKAKK